MERVEVIELDIGHTVHVTVTAQIEQAIAVARDARNQGATKVSAVRKVYPSIADHPKGAIWFAIMNGVDMTSRGAVTYYYMMRREFRRRPVATRIQPVG